MKILLCTYDIMKIGGIETSFFLLAQYLKSKGHEVGVRYTIAAPMQLERYKGAGIDVGPQHPENCDILFIGSVWRRPKQIRSKLVVQQVHADWSDEFWDNSPEAVKLLKSADLESDAFAPVSESAAAFVAKHTAKPIVVMNNIAPAATAIERIKGNKLVIAAFTRMSTEKGKDNYIALRDKLRAFGIEADLRVYTNGEAPEGWTAREPVPDIKTELTDVDFVASLADTESFGYTIAEANSCDIPCIIKRTNSTGEFFDDKSNVIVDTVDVLTKKDLRRKISVQYRLRENSEKSIDVAIEKLQELADGKRIIKCMKTFYDIEAKKTRGMGEVFTVHSDRAAELLGNKLRLVEVV